MSPNCLKNFQSLNNSKYFKVLLNMFNSLQLGWFEAIVFYNFEAYWFKYYLMVLADVNLVNT